MLSHIEWPKVQLLRCLFLYSSKETVLTLFAYNKVSSGILVPIRKLLEMIFHQMEIEDAEIQQEQPLQMPRHRSLKMLCKGQHWR